MRLIVVLAAIYIYGMQALFAASSAPQKSLEEAIELYNRGQWVAAEHKLKALRELESQVTYSHKEQIDYYLTMVAYQSGNKEVEHYISRYLYYYPRSVYANDIEYAHALYLCEKERYAEADEQFKRVDYNRLSPVQQDNYNIRMGYLTFWKGDHETARNYFQNINIESPLYYHALYYRSYISYLNDSSSTARAGFDALLESDSYRELAPFYVMHINFREGLYQEVLDRGIELMARARGGRQLEILRILAEASYKMGRYDETLRYIERFGEMGGEMGREENYIKGFTLSKLNRHDEAEEYLRIVCGLDDALTQSASYNLAHVYVNMGEMVKAKQSFSMAANENFDADIAQSALFNYGKIEYELGGGIFNEAINTLTRYINKYPTARNIGDAKIMLIAAYYNSRNYDVAYNAIKQIQHPDSNLRAALQKIAFFRAVEEFNQGNTEAAMHSLQESAAIGINADYLVQSYFWQGEIYFMDRDYVSALNNYNTYLTRAPKNDNLYPLALYNIAYTHLMQGNESDARTYFEKYVAADSLSVFVADAYNRLGDIYYAKREFEPAQENYKISIKKEVAPYNLYAQYYSAMIAGLLEGYESKETALRGIISVGKGEWVDDAYYELGRSYLVRGQYNEGVRQLENYLSFYPTSSRVPQVLSDLGLAHVNLGNTDIAISYYDKAIKSAPNSSIAKDALLGIRAIYVNQGDAQKYFRYASSVGLDGDLNAMSRDSLSYSSAMHIYLHTSQDYTPAADAFQNYIKSYPKGHYQGDALFFLGDCYIKLDNTPKAIETLTRLTKLGMGEYTERVYTSLSRLNFSIESYAQAANAYHSLYETASSDPVRREAMQGYIASVLAIKDDEATLLLDRYIADKKAFVSPEQLRTINFEKANVYARSGDHTAANALYRQISSEPLTSEGAQSTYIVIENLFKQGNYDLASEMVFEFSETETRHVYWLAKSFLVLGDIYKAQGDNFQARATYQSIVDGYSIEDDGVIDSAKELISNLPQ